MRALIVALTLSILVTNLPALAQGLPDVTPQMTAMETRLLTDLSPAQRTWIREEATRQRSASGEPGKISPEALKTYPSLHNMGNADIEALAFLVLMQAAKSAQEDVKSVMAGVKAINAAKAKSRDVQQRTTASGEASSLRLQTTMDRRAKLLETASNLMKKWRNQDRPLFATSNNNQIRIRSW